MNTLYGHNFMQNKNGFTVVQPLSSTQDPYSFLLQQQNFFHSGGVTPESCAIQNMSMKKSKIRKAHKLIRHVQLQVFGVLHMKVYHSSCGKISVTKPSLFIRITNTAVAEVLL
jgi:hypothetical protein